MTPPPAVSCRSVTVDYGEVRALSDVNLEVQIGETLALLGPSGSGKTTLLLAIAGFLAIRKGEIHIGGRLVSTSRQSVPPEKRSLAMVFQNYALWPHLDAVNTVAYPKRRAGESKSDAVKAALKLLRKLDVEKLARRRPGQLSGGEQQRVGLARAMAREASVYLFDEPTAHLDAAIRQSVAGEMALRQHESGATAVYSTHDAAEALAVADRVAILRKGTIVQLGTPQEVYDQPVDVWAARLTGPASVISDQDGESIVRPDWVEVGGPLAGEVKEVWFRGSHTDYRVITHLGAIDVRLLGPTRFAVGDRSGWTIRRSWKP